MADEQVTLRDGTAVLIRPVEPEDKELDHEALGARAADTGDGVGVARYVRLESQPDVAEAAVAVLDEWQHRGVGSALLWRVTERVEIDVELPFEPTGLGAALRAAATGLIRLRP